MQAKKGMDDYGNCMLNEFPVSENSHYCLLYNVSVLFSMVSVSCWTTS